MTQNERIHEYMKKHGSITTKDAYEQLGVTRLSARIYELKEQGVKIEKKTEKSRNRFGETVYYDRFYLKGEEK